MLNFIIGFATGVIIGEVFSIIIIGFVSINKEADRYDEEYIRAKEAKPTLADAEPTLVEAKPAPAENNI